ncbi:hypothetical protein CCR75_006214 [Bremia lactucae]|uniref:Uncharacterized protein n=1 Tax=Bremia lactucae TaxID=4779 RepID=A0A976FJE8_BRELC|nr:hypothetical protein CCR75_006214 [Bremia lactucae]
MGNTVTLLSACEYGDLAEVHRLLKTSTAENLEAKDDSRRTPLLLAVASLKHSRVRQELIDDFDNLNDLNDFGGSETAAMYLTRQAKDVANRESSKCEAEETVDNIIESDDVDFIPKEAEILHLLLQRRVNLDHRDENGWTALHHACFVQNAVAVKMLIHAGAKPMRENYGLLPQDLLQRGHMSEWVAQAQELKEILDQITDKSAYTIKLLAFRPSGVVQLDMGGQVEKGSLVLVSEEDSAEIATGSYHYVPAGAHGQLTINTKDIPPASTVRFVYVKSDINTMSREVVASGCNAVVQASVGEIFQYELFLYERVVEVESIPDFELIDQPLIVLKRIGIVEGDDIDWITLRPYNHIVAVNDIRIDEMEFAEAVHVLQENNGRQCTRLLMQNYSACGDFIPEKILGVGVVGKYASLHPIDEDYDVGSNEHTHEELGQRCPDECHDDNGESRSCNNASLKPVNKSVSAVQLPTETSPPPSAVSQLFSAEEREVVSKVLDDYEIDNPAAINSSYKVSASSTIETVVPLHNSLQLVAQLQHGISISHKSS